VARSTVVLEDLASSGQVLLGSVGITDFLILRHQGDDTQKKTDSEDPLGTHDV
jgi:hypothetical protein